MEPFWLHFFSQYKVHRTTRDGIPTLRKLDPSVVKDVDWCYLSIHDVTHFSYTMMFRGQGPAFMLEHTDKHDMRKLTR